MNMHWVDWLIVGGLLLVTLWTGLHTKRYMRGGWRTISPPTVAPDAICSRWRRGFPA
jgi:hypothetical protein